MSNVIACPNCGIQSLGGTGGLAWCMNTDCAFLWKDYEMIDFKSVGEEN
jgi:hypothetical protein